LSGRQIISVFSQDSPYKVYDQEEWWSDKWNGLDFGRDFDFSRTFADQFKELYEDVPHMSLYNTNVENSYYTNYALNMKNVYLVFGAGNAEDCMYGKFIVNCNDSIDCLSVYDCEFCYEGIASEKCYSCRYFVNCRNCNDCTMVEDCSGSKDLIACFGLRNKQYCIMNKQYTRDEYEKIAKDYEYLTEDKVKFLRANLEKLKANLPHIQSHIYASEDSTGDGLYNCKNTANSFDCKECEDCKYMYFSPKCKMTHDCSFCAPDGTEFCYNVCSVVGLSNSMSCFYVWNGDNIFYSIECHNSNNLFGCTGLKSASYCIFNKQYTKEEYNELVPRIIEHMKTTGEWGEYLPYSLSAFAYNETIANEYFPITEEQAVALGSRWAEKKEERLEGDAFVPPADIRDAGDDICDKVLICMETGKKYKIMPKELEFYRRFKIPVPRLSPDRRHFDRLEQHNFQQLWDKKCDKCDKDIETIYKSDTLKIFCEQCYLKEIY